MPKSVRITTFTPARSFMLTYRENEVNVCPGCSKSHWHIGRVSVECHFCGVVLPLPYSQTTPWNTTVRPVIVHKRAADAPRGRFTVNSRA